MPTRPQTWRFRQTYDGFTHRGLRTAILAEGSTPIDRAGRVIRVNGAVLDEDGTQVGRFTRLLASGDIGLRARHEHLELDPAARGRGFARALHAHSEDVYRRMGIGLVTMHAEHVGSLLWPRLGFDFDLREQPGATEAQQRANAVLDLLSPTARQVRGRLRPAEVLARGGEGVAALRRRLPTPERAATGDLDGVLLDPVSIAAFSADGTELMLGASFDALKRLA